MRINAHIGSKVLGCTRARWHSLLASSGMLPTSVEPAKGGARYCWDLSQLFSVYVMQYLFRIHRINAGAVEGLVRTIAALGDEQLDAAIRGGRSWLMAVGKVVAPELFFRENVEGAAADLKDGLDRIGATVVAIDVGPLWTELQNRVRAAREVDHAHTTD